MDLKKLILNLELTTGKVIRIFLLTVRNITPVQNINTFHYLFGRVTDEFDTPKTNCQPPLRVSWQLFYRGVNFNRYFPKRAIFIVLYMRSLLVILSGHFDPALTYMYVHLRSFLEEDLPFT